MMTSIKDLILSSQDKLLVYIHIPFCKTKCHYCYYFTSFNHNEEYQRRYIRKIIWELEYYKEIFKKRRNDIIAIYIGGGTPSELTKENLMLLLSSIDKIIRPCELPNLVQFTMELNPSIVGQKECDAKMSIMKRYSVNRISYGVQTFNNEELKKNNCAHRVAQIYKAVHKAQENDFSYNLDLMFGLLGATFESGIENILATIDILPPQIQLNSPIYYTKNSPFINQIEGNRGRLLTKGQQWLLVLLCRILFLKLRYGHTPYPPSNELSLKKKDLNIFAPLQWNGLADVVGIGCSARSINLKNNIITQNLCDTEEYMKNTSHFKFEKINNNYRQLLKRSVIDEFFKDRLAFPRFENNRKGKIFNLRSNSNLYMFLVLKGIEMEVFQNVLPSRYFYSEAIKIYPHNSLGYFCLIDLLIRKKKYRVARDYIQCFPENNNSNQLLSMLFLIVKGLRPHREQAIKNIEKLIREKLFKCGIDYNRLDIKEYHYKKLQIPEAYLHQLLNEYNFRKRNLGAEIPLREYLKRARLLSQNLGQILLRQI